ncbi:MAG: MBOAT family O-acyltransferase [Terracidiphilus sp.]|jgi:D-alanyl-lipoteichoic acid acyltransferase DltB (MBOAT superfamily)
MDSASFQFVAFGLAVAVVSNFSRSRVWRSIVLMVASIVFLGLLAHNPIVFLPLAGFLLLGYAGLVLLERGWTRSSVWSILAVIFIYIWLKKYTFLPEGIFLHAPYFTLGLSYIFFRVLHLLIEMGDNREKRHIGPGAYLLYTLNFTTLLSGPIQRYDEFARDQFAMDPIALGPRVIGLQMERIIRGFFKVNVLAMLLHAAHEDALAQMLQPVPLSLKFYAAFKLAIVYPFFLYANFSGYIDIVIALARLMRVRLPENFDRPFSASSVLDFWNQWHITLSNWLKTYVYNPLLVALMRRISSRAMQPFLGVFCFFVTFFLIGVWHGRTAEFIVFGVLTGGGMSINKLWQIAMARVMGRNGYKALANNVVYIAFGRGLNFIWFAFTLFWFWADWRQLEKISTALVVAQWLGVWLATWLSATLVLAIWEWMRAALLSIKTAEGPVLTSRYARVVYATALGLSALVITVLLNQHAPDIVYKAF